MDWSRWVKNYERKNNIGCNCEVDILCEAMELLLDRVKELEKRFSDYFCRELLEGSSRQSLDVEDDCSGDTKIDCADARIHIHWKDRASHDRRARLTKLIGQATNNYNEKGY